MKPPALESVKEHADSPSTPRSIGRAGRHLPWWPASVGGVFAVLVAVLLVSSPALASSAVTGGVSYVWTPPYSGVIFAIEKDNESGGCNDVTSSLHFVLKTGDILGGASVSAQSCSTTPGSWGFERQWVGAGLDGLGNSFKGANGTYKIGVKWDFDVKLDLTLSGSNCSDGEAEVSFGWYLGYYNLGTSKLVFTADGTLAHHEVSDEAVSSSWKVVKDETETSSVNLTHDGRYYVVALLWVTVAASTEDTTSLNGGSCGAVSIFTYESSPTAKLVHVALQ